MHVCEVGAVGNFSDCQPGGPEFNPWSRVESVRRPSLATLSVGRDVKPLLVSQRYIGGLKRTHTLVDDKSRVG